MPLKTWVTKVNRININGDDDVIELKLKIRKKVVNNISLSCGKLVDIYNYTVNFDGIKREKIDYSAKQYRESGEKNVRFLICCTRHNMFGEAPEGYTVPQEIQDFFNNLDSNKVYLTPEYENLVDKAQKLFYKYVKLSFNDKLHSNPLLNLTEEQKKEKSKSDADSNSNLTDHDIVK
jgi:hypothetical protein